MYRIFFVLTTIILFPTHAEAADTPATGDKTVVSVLSVPVQEAISTNSTTFKNYLITGDKKYLDGLTPEQQKEVEDKKSEVKEKVNSDEFMKKYFSIGLYANFDVGANNRVQNARVVNGIVRVEESNSAQIGLALQAYRLFPTKSGKSAWGPFIALITSDNGGITSGAIGGMYALAPKAGFVADQTSINFGLGVSVSPGTQVLGDGINENMPLPAGETEVRYKKTTLYGVMFAVSFGF